MALMACLVGIVEAIFLGMHLLMKPKMKPFVMLLPVSGVVPAVFEPVGVCRDDGKQPDVMSPIPWWRGLLLLWDFTCSDTSSLKFCTGSVKS